MAGNSSLFFGSSISLDPRLQFLTWTKRHHTSRADRDFLARLRIPSWPLILVPQVEVAEAGKLDLFAVGQCMPHLLEEQIDQLTGLSLVQTQLVEQRLSHLRFRQSHAFILEILRPTLHSDRHESRLTNGPRPRPRGCENCPEISSLKRRFFFRFLCRAPETHRTPGCREAGSTPRRLHGHVVVAKTLSRRPPRRDRDERVGSGRSPQIVAFGRPVTTDIRFRTRLGHM